MTEQESPFTKELMQTIFDAIRHCKVLGIKIHSIEGKQLTTRLAYSEQIIGNPVTGVIHGGALTTLLDTTCGISLPIAMEEFTICPTLDLRIDYMSAAKPHQDIFGRAEVYRITKSVVFAKGIAFQEDETKPIAHCVATFMRLPQAVTDSVDAKDYLGNNYDG
ncbi:MAG: PaaI family thioesterase [Oceanicoccus sp.]|uniref:PaaI family thioesterase n=1 Tax=Oceanicoccus sp. TaxID=2691044 RepID=UPI00261CFEE4|nr:PaaI family thioesterase [Oceanicoccus sp.]MDG1773726.1 PaaI family thioesterase [Oceanicoccus sp.]